ncbi:MAG: LacI family transcriptional regulator [Clostridiales bacterium]|nr:LacI family transcriptional regulator [Clostridiales bacterium]
MATMKDVAELAGVSIATVSHVINGTKKLSAETTERVLLAIARAQYRPNTAARSLHSGQSGTIGVLVEDIRGLPVAEIVSGIADTLSHSGYMMILYDLHLLEQLYNQYTMTNSYRERISNGTQLLLSSGIDGLIYVGMHDRYLKDLFAPISCPLVIAYSLGTAQDTSVTYSNFDSAARLTRLLIAKGHRRIAVICGHPQSYPARRRLEGFRSAMFEAGLDVPQEYIQSGVWEGECGAAAARSLLALPNPPSAIFAMNDLMAAGCYRVLQEAGLSIPGDMAVVGFDNREIASFLQPPLTTVALPSKEIGVRAAIRLLDQIRNPAIPPARDILPCSIIERSSV